MNSSLDLVVPYDPRPVFTSLPLAYSGSPGDNITANLAVTIDANSVQPLTYQWYYLTNGVSNLLADGVGPSGSSTLNGATTANLQIANAQTGDSGFYYVVVANAFGTNTSSQALVTISGAPIPPQITSRRLALSSRPAGLTTQIANGVSGSPVPTLHWQFNGVDLANGPGPSGSSVISGATTAALTISNPQHPGDEGTYSLIAENAPGKATNDTLLVVFVPPSIDTQPTNLAVISGQPASFTVAASGFPVPTYR